MTFVSPSRKRLWSAGLLATAWLIAGCSNVDPNGGEVELSDESMNWQTLFNENNLTGWEVVGAGDWSAENGELVVRRQAGDSRPGWLVTKKDYGDFKLRLKFQSRLEHFNSGILLRDPGHAKVFRPAFNGYEIQVQQGEGEGDRNTNGAIYDLARAFWQPIEPDEWTEFEAHCIGDHIVSYMNGKKMAEVHSRRSYKGAVGLQLHGGEDDAELRWKDIEILDLPPAQRDFQLLEEKLEQAPGEFVDLFESDQFDQIFDVYWQAGASWKLSNGVLRGESPSEISWIYTKDGYADFVLSFEYRISEGGNAGIGLRFPWDDMGNVEARPAFAGYECQIAETDESNPTGSIYELARSYPSDLWRRPIDRPNGWNQGSIYAKGDHLVTYVNRRKTAEAHDDRSLAGRIGFQVHEPTEWVEYRNVRIKVIR